ncbi:hypothetical protein TRFO_23890 [Tritrichomonas foetus]|uniref:Uncharacterized protein n=1 Tax=Tritrichomonas foetus TaxID=1144522 RepID=A0A1J4KE99_9EUKA|nr:hypothetical protein TRFO_23890 [Tritrichomonas foetus]|eukprot:OHT07781.1 hypothetical protein TRFO_23890 [Tritrichomonas foetus]
MRQSQNITHVRGLYAVDDTFPCNKFVFDRDCSYYQNYKRKKHANAIRFSSRDMKLFDPVYHSSMIQYQEICRRADGEIYNEIFPQPPRKRLTRKGKTNSKKKQLKSSKTRQKNAKKNSHKISNGDDFPKIFILEKKYFKKWYIKWCTQNALRLHRLSRSGNSSIIT